MILNEPSIWVGAVFGAFALKHFLADFILQPTWIVQGKEADTRWALPLAVHCGIHAGLALVIILLVAPRLWWLALVDFGLHAVIDRAKSLFGHALRLQVDNPRFWWLLGFDQFLHQATNILLALVVLMA